MLSVSHTWSKINSKLLILDKIYFLNELDFRKFEKMDENENNDEIQELERIVSELKLETASINEEQYQVQLVNKRRNAVIRQKKTYEMNGHKFQPKVFSQPTMCTFCSEFIWYLFLSLFRVIYSRFQKKVHYYSISI